MELGSWPIEKGIFLWQKDLLQTTSQETGLIGVKSSCVQTTASTKNVKAKFRQTVRQRNEETAMWLCGCYFVYWWPHLKLVLVYRKPKELVMRLFRKPKKNPLTHKQKTTTNKQNQTKQTNKQTPKKPLRKSYCFLPLHLTCNYFNASFFNLLLNTAVLCLTQATSYKGQEIAGDTWINV